MDFYYVDAETRTKIRVDYFGPVNGKIRSGSVLNPCQGYSFDRAPVVRSTSTVE
jgi:hypothetical protein